MITSNIKIGNNVDIDPSSRFNNVNIADGVKISSNVNLFGSFEHPMQIGFNSYIGPFCFLEGHNAFVKIGRNVSFAQRVTLLTASAPNASDKLQKIFPLIKGPIEIGDHVWIGAHSIIMPNVKIGSYSVVAAGSFVNTSFPDYSVIGGVPAKLIRSLTQIEIDKLND
jgi:acetyltransferase-like isoleucine patch superfamily enzyme